MQTTLSLRMGAGLFAALAKTHEGRVGHGPWPEDAARNRADLASITSKDEGTAKALHKYSKLRGDVERVLARRKPEVKEITRLPDRIERMGNRAKELTQEATRWAESRVGQMSDEKLDPKVRDAQLKMFSAAEVASSGVAMVDMPADPESGRPARTLSMNLKQMQKEAKELAVRVKELVAEGRPEAGRDVAAFELAVMRRAGKKFLENAQEVETTTAHFLRQVERTARKGTK